MIILNFDYPSLLNKIDFLMRPSAAKYRDFEYYKVMGSLRYCGIQ